MWEPERSLTGLTSNYYALARADVQVIYVRRKLWWTEGLWTTSANHRWICCGKYKRQAPRGKIMAEPSKIRSPWSFQSLFSFCRGECTDRQKARISHFAFYIQVTKQIYTEQSKYDHGLSAWETVRKLWAMCHKVLLSTRQGGKCLNYLKKENSLYWRKTIK